MLLPQDDRQELEQLGRDSDRSLSAEVRRAIRLYLAWTRSRASERDAEEEPGVIRL